MPKLLVLCCAATVIRQIPRRICARRRRGGAIHGSRRASGASREAADLRDYDGIVVVGSGSRRFAGTGER